MSSAQLLVNAGLVCFAATSGMYLQNFPSSNQNKRLPSLAIGLFLLSTTLVSLALVVLFTQGHFQPSSSIILVVCISWITVIGHFFFNMRLMGAFVSPTCTVILLFYLFLLPGKGSPSEAMSRLGTIHIFMSILGEAFAICACAISAAFLIQRRALKQKKASWLKGVITPLDKLDKALLVTLWAGFVFITFGLITGAVYSQYYLTYPRQELTGKIIWALAVWVWYLATLLGRNIFHLPERRIAQMSMVGFLLLSLSFFGLIQWGENS